MIPAADAIALLRQIIDGTGVYNDSSFFSFNVQLDGFQYATLVRMLVGEEVQGEDGDELDLFVDIILSRNEKALNRITSAAVQ